MLLLDGQRPTLLEPDSGGADRGVVQLTNPELRNDPTRSHDELPVLPTQSLGVRRERHLSDDGFAEQVVVTNYTLAPQTVSAELLLDADGADIFEVRGYERAARGALPPVEVEADGIVFRYEGLDGVELRSRIRFTVPPDAITVAPADADGSIVSSWRLGIDPGSSVSLGWQVRPAWRAARTTAGGRGARPDGEHPFPPAVEGPTGSVRLGVRQPDGPWADAGVSIQTDDELVNLILARGAADMRLLDTEGPGPGEHFVSAGVPWFATLFGRDAILASLFMLPMTASLARTTLEVLAGRQATAIDDWRDAEPGKILHELRTGEMARTGELPFTPYYGTADATALWLLLLAETHAWTGDDALVDRLWPHALAALAWMEQHGDHDGDGFIEYNRRSERGLRNQGWKDSHDAIRDRHGAIADGPIALAEVQGYAIAARRGLAGLAAQRGDAELADRLSAEATRLQGRFEEAFWIPSLGRYAMALDGAKRPMDALASNIGHCLWTGILDRGRAGSVARDLTGEAMFSGWGLRTFASDQPGYNPLGYHTGTVWPHDTAIAVAGLKRYGFHDEASALGSALLDAARHFPLFRFPELFCGFDRGHSPVPVAYPVACAPQAWAASSPFYLLRSLLGLEPDAPGRALRIVRPTLPRPVQKVVISGMRVGDASVDLLFHRWRGTTSAEVLGRSGDVEVVVHL